MIDSISVANGRSLSRKLFRYYLSLKVPFRHSSARKNLFLSACYIWNDKVALREMDQKLPFGELIGYGKAYWDSISCYSKVFRLHAILHDAAGSVRSHIGKLPGDYYMIAQGPNFCLLAHLTGLIFCLSKKIFVPSIFNSVDFRISISLIVLDTELIERNIIEELVHIFLMVFYEDFQFVRQRLSNLINRQHGTQVIYMEMREVVESWII